MSSITKDFSRIITTSLKTFTPEFIFKNKVRISNSKIESGSFALNLNQYEKVYVIGFGKASSAMATELEKYLIDRIESGIVITKYGFKTPTRKIKIYEAGHPIPDENTIKHSQEIIKLLEKTTSNDLVICLISGGGSALFEMLEPQWELTTLQSLNEYLIKQNISIYEINRFRKAFSKVKDGKLLKYIFPSTCISFILSDVPGNDLSVIASGPTFINKQHTYTEIKNINEVKEILSKNISSPPIGKQIVEKKYEEYIVDYYKNRVHNLIIASNEDIVNSSRDVITNLGYEIQTIEYNLLSSTEEVCKKIIDELSEFEIQDRKSKKAFIFGGETFLKVTGNGKGGRNSHLILQILNEIISKKLIFNFQYLIASLATDGNDGPTDAAGAFITDELVEKLRNEEATINSSLKKFDSYNFFNQHNCLIRTGVTYTNVADLIIGLFQKQ